MYHKLLSEMNESYKEHTGVTPAVSTDVGIRFRVLSQLLAQFHGEIQEQSHQIFPQTSTGAALAYHGELKGILRKQGTPATGTLTFSRHLPAQNIVTIPMGTVVATNTVPQRYATTTKAAVIPQGEVSVSVTATAEEAGEESNFIPSALSVLVSSPPGVSRVTSTDFSGGESPENEDDYRKRVLIAYQQPSNGSNTGYYLGIARGVEGVRDVRILSRPRGRGTVDVVFTPTHGSTAATINSALAKALMTKKEIAVDLEIYPATEKKSGITISVLPKEGYAYAPVAKEVEETIASYFWGLPIGEAMRRSHLGRMVLDTQGVKDYEIISPTTDIYPSPSQVVTQGSLLIKRWVNDAVEAGRITS